MTNAIPLLLGSIENSFWDNVSFQLIGFMIVMITLTGIWLSLEVIGLFFKSAARRETAAADSAPAPAPVEEGVDPELFAVIAAAIDTVVRQPHQVVRISRRSGSAPRGQSAWSSEGRRDIYRSHTIR